MDMTSARLSKMSKEIFKEAKKLARYNRGKKITTRDIFTATSILLRNSDKLNKAKPIALLASSYRAHRGSDAEYTIEDILNALVTVE